LTGAGIGYRPAIAAALLREPRSVDFIELLFEACTASAPARREAEGVARIWPAVVHGVKLSLGSAEGIDADRARRLGAFARSVRAAAISEHASFVRAGGHEIGHLTAVPFCPDAARVIARNITIARRHWPDVPFLVENVAWGLRPPGDVMEEGAFHAEIVERSGCDLLLDVANVYANARNAGVDPRALLEGYPLERVGMVHLAGGVLARGFYFDTHGHAVEAEVFDMLDIVLRRAGPVPVVLERDEHFPEFSELRGEIARARSAVAVAEARAGSRAAPRSPVDASPALEVDAAELAALEARLAALLCDDQAPADPAFSARDVLRARGVLREKRVDDALPLLPRLSSLGQGARDVARAHVAAAPRPRALPAIADAFAITRAAEERADLAAAARLDRLVLGAHYTCAPDGRVAPRLAPFIGRERTTTEDTWVVKGLGGRAQVRIFVRRRGAEAASRPGATGGRAA
jgi:uncharacterized protein